MDSIALLLLNIKVTLLRVLSPVLLYIYFFFYRYYFVTLDIYLLILKIIVIILFCFVAIFVNDQLNTKNNDYIDNKKSNKG